MDAEELALFTGVANAERLVALREQLWLLNIVREEVQGQAQIVHRLVTGTPGYQWHSAAERGYAERARELGVALERAARAIDDACEAVSAGLARLRGVE